MGEERDKGRENAERDVPPDVGAGGGAQADDDGRDEAEKGDDDSGEKRLSHASKYHASPFVARWIPILAQQAPAQRRALDLAMGRGRHAVLLARTGLRTFGVDLAAEAVRDAMMRAAADGLLVRGWCADLTRFPLPAEWFDVVVVTRYLQRDLFASIRDAVVQGGFVLYETFTVHQRTFGVGPSSPHHLLDDGELRARFEDWEVMFYEEVIATEAVAQLVARKPATRNRVR